MVLVCTLLGLYMDVWPFGLVGDIMRPLGSAKNRGSSVKKYPISIFISRATLAGTPAIRQDHRFEVPEPPARESDAV